MALLIESPIKIMGTNLTVSNTYVRVLFNLLPAGNSFSAILQVFENKAAYQQNAMQIPNETIPIQTPEITANYESSQPLLLHLHQRLKDYLQALNPTLLIDIIDIEEPTEP